MLVLALACTPAWEPPPDAVLFLWDPRLALTSFPDDSLLSDGHIDLSDHAEDFEGLPDTFTLVPALERLDGFGTTAAMTLRFKRPLPEEVEVHLIDTDTRQEHPVELERTDEGETLLVRPWTPLRPSTEYLLWADGEGLYPSEVLHEVLYGQEDFQEHEGLARVTSRLRELGVEAPAMALFTTQSLFDEDDAVADLVADEEAPAITLGDCTDEAQVRLCDASITVLDFVPGTHLDGPVQVEGDYTLPVLLTLPLTTEPRGVLIYGHGLGGDRGEARRVGRYLAEAGWAVAAIDAPRHGDHPTTTDSEDFFWIFQFFGLETSPQAFDVEQLRDNWRAATWDKLQLARGLREGVQGALPAGLPTVYAGHSLGGIMGVQLLAQDPEILAAELRVPGGRVSEIVERGETFSILVELMKPSGTRDGEVARFFPMLQTAIERGDSANWAARVDQDLLVSMVVDDTIIPNSTTALLARALGLEHAPQVQADIGLPVSAPLPLSGNLFDLEGEPRTALLFQFATHWDEGVESPASHTHTFGSDSGVAQSLHYWSTWPSPEVIDPL